MTPTVNPAIAITQAVTSKATRVIDSHLYQVRAFGLWGEKCCWMLELLRTLVVVLFNLSHPIVQDPAYFFFRSRHQSTHDTEPLPPANRYPSRRHRRPRVGGIMELGSREASIRLSPLPI